MGILALAAEHDCELSLGRHLVAQLARHEAIELKSLQAQFGRTVVAIPSLSVPQHSLARYDPLLPSHPEAVTYVLT